MPISILPADPSCARRLAEIDESAYANDPMRQSLSSYASASVYEREQHLQWSTLLLAERLKSDTSGLILIAMDEESGDIMGWVDWTRPGFSAPEIMRNDEKATVKRPGAESTESKVEMSPCLNVEAGKAFMKIWEDARKWWMGEREDYWCLAKLVVDPKWQRRGAGDRLLKHMLQEIDGRRLDVYLGTPPSGVKLLERNGFVVLEKMEYLKGWEFAFMLRKGRRE